MGKKKLDPVEQEKARLWKVFESLTPNKKVIADGLIEQAARLRVRLDILWKDLQENGEAEYMTQSDKTEPFEKERPAAKQFTATDKNYQAIIKQLNEMCPKDVAKSKLEELMNDECDS